METPLEGPQAVSVSGGGALAGKAAVCSATRQLTPRCAETGRRFAAMRSAEVRSAAGRASEIRSAAGRASEIRSAAGRASEIRSACNRPKSKEAGFSITGVLVSSSIGLIVLTGTMQTLVNISHRLSVQEARLKQPLLHSYLIERFAKTGRCTKTLEGLKITENAAVTLDSGVKEYWANPTTAPRQHVASLKDAAGTVLRDLHSAQTQKDFKRDFDIDKFARLIFRGFHPEGDSGTPAVDFDDPGDTEEGRARLEAFVMDKGMFRKPIIIQLRGVKLKKDGHGTGIHKITACHSVDSVADVSAEITALKARIKALEDLGLSVSGNDLVSSKHFKTAKDFIAGGIIYAGSGGIVTLHNGSIKTTGTGNIYTEGSGKIYTSGGNIEAGGSGKIKTAAGNIEAGGSGNILTSGGWIAARGGGDIATHGGNIYTRGSGKIYTHGGHIEAGGSGNISTHGGSVFTRNGGDIATFGADGNIYTGSGHIWTGGSGDIYTHGGNVYTRGAGIIRTSGGDIYTLGTGRINSGGDMFARGVGNIYTTNGHIRAKGANGNIFTDSGNISTGGSGTISASGTLNAYGSLNTHGTGIRTGGGIIRTVGGPIYMRGGVIELCGGRVFKSWSATCHARAQ